MSAGAETIGGEPPSGGVMPVVARPNAGPPVWLLVGAAVLIGLMLFVALETRRAALSAPAVRPRAADMNALPASPPPLYIPPAPPLQPLTIIEPAPPPPAAPAPRPPQIVYVPQPAPPATPDFPIAPPPPPRVSNGPALVIDNTGPATTTQGPNVAPIVAGPLTGEAIAGARAGAGVLANRATTVTQGTLIPAVLETALDSTRPGLARAIVSRDIRGFDGARVLIPRGSRLIGEYRSDARTGQNRMLVNWVRLIRPDGASIAIGSPVSDPLGRGGVRASVDSHFFERFAGAILQSALDVGVNLAATSTGSPVVVLPGTVGVATQGLIPRDVQPTLKVKAARSISVFVARDLDFTGVEAR